MGKRMLIFGICMALFVIRCSSLRCLECTDVPHPTSCERIITCPADSSCLLRQYITTSGAVLYSSGCRSHQRCGAAKKRGVYSDDQSYDVYSEGQSDDLYSEDQSDDLVTCEECCDREYCNIEGCGTKAIDRSRRGPYCFECSKENGVYGCRNTKLCDRGYSCSIDKTNFPGLYTTTCIPETLCNNLPTQTNSTGVALVGKRSDPGITISLPYCCRGDFCNDILKFVTNSSTAVDGVWATWGDWSSCSTSCGYGGAQSRSRSCDNPPPQNNGASCTGDAGETRDCLVEQCPIDGGWSAWSDWSGCTKSCGSDVLASRSRTCSNPPPQHNGVLCQGNSYDVIQCDVPVCPMPTTTKLTTKLVTTPTTTSTAATTTATTTTPPTTTLYFRTLQEKCRHYGYNSYSIIHVCYKFHFEEKTWDEASATCSLEQATLAVLDTSNKWYRLKIRLQLEQRYHNKEVWIGARKTRAGTGDHAFYWETGSKVTHAYWASQEPNNSGDCVFLTSRETFLWHDDLCKRARPFFCTMQE